MHSQNIKPRQKKHPAEKDNPRLLRQKLMDAARKLFAEKGYEGLPMRRIGSEAGCSAMAVYHYFNSKEELLFTICEETCQQLMQIRTLEIQKETTPAGRLRSTMRTFMQFGLSHPNHFRLLFMMEIPPGPVAERRNTIVQQGVNNLREGVRECIEAKHLPLDVELTVQALRVSTEGLVSASIAHLVPIENTDTLIEYLLQILTRGLE